jgi:hypothetical protein
VSLFDFCIFNLGVTTSMTPENERTALQIVNLSPGEDSLEKLTEMHPMRQIVWATIVQVSVLGFMMGSFAVINMVLP